MSKNQKLTVVLGILLGVPILACGGCMGLAFLFAPTAEQVAAEAEERKERELISAEEAKAEAAKPQLNKDNWAKVKEGMNYKEVVSIIGNPSDELSSSNLGDVRTVMYQWKAGFLGTNANCTFQNDKLVMKAQAGL